MGKQLNTGPLYEALVTQAARIAEITDRANHPDEHKPGGACVSCTLRVVSNLLLRLSITPERAAGLGILVAESNNYMRNGKGFSHLEFNQERLRLIEVEIRYLLVSEEKRVEVSEDRAKLDGIAYEMLATMLYNLNLSSEEVGNVIAAKVAAIEAEGKARDDHYKRRN